MTFRSPVMRLSIALALLTVNLLFLADLIGLIPDQSKYALEQRKTLSESLAFQFSAAAEKGDFTSIQHTLRALVDRNEDLKSAAIRTTNGELIALAGEHLAHWKTQPDGKSTATFVHVPVFRKNEKWATVEMRFASLWADTLAGSLSHSFLGLLLFVSLGSFICYFFVIRRALRELDPSSVIPERVRRAFDTLQEGVLILDEKEQIVMANKSFAHLLAGPVETIIGRKGSELEWVNHKKEHHIEELPWLKAQRTNSEQKGSILILMNNIGKELKLAVNATLVTDSSGNCRGTLVTLDDMTQLEEKNLELRRLVEDLQLAQEEIQGKNKELEFMANHDPLTLCLNRRRLSQKFEALFVKSKAIETPLCCLMVDIDFFKLVNDRYGHQVGDRVLRAVADTLKRLTRDADLVGRYGGEEFCVVLPKVNIQTAAKIAERIRQTIEKQPCSGVNITISMGLSSIECNAVTLEDLIRQADEALYSAKTSGRNRVVVWGQEHKPVIEVHEPMKLPVHYSQGGKPASIDVDKALLLQRVKELEELVKKRTTENEQYRMYDSKTGLPSRSLFEDRIGVEIARSKRMEWMLAVVSLRITAIKRIEETLGYKTAEQLVKACAQRLTEALRKNIDAVTLMKALEKGTSISQLSDAEFGILLTDMKQVEHVTWVTKRLMDCLEKPFTIEDNEIHLSCHVGVSIFPHDGNTPEELYRSASNACRFAKRMDSRERCLFSSPALNKRAIKQFQIENLLFEAIPNNELRLVYQPKIESATARIAGFEALLRWKNRRLGDVPPNVFIPIAEYSGQIAKLGGWVLENACKQVRTWMDMGLDATPLAINVSGIELRQQALTDRIQKALAHYGLDAHLLEIEITESALVSNNSKYLDVLNQLKNMGIRVTIDDFGTGYSSLHCLKTIPLCCLKIDRSFVSDINESEKANTLIATIMAIARQLDLEVVAEGVEHKHQVDYLKSLGCHYMQGYYFSRPIPPEEIVGLLQKQPLPTSNGTSAAALRQATMQSLVELEKPIRLQRSA